QLSVHPVKGPGTGDAEKLPQGERVLPDESGERLHLGKAALSGPDGGGGSQRKPGGSARGLRSQGSTSPARIA
ncbi:hypothetical protein, partial [Streptomyces griseorubens]|uniref:hypothetical protein n=1 Tax=Streptomyces griseorubens TaxID=66897 RepID=UPI003517F2CF